jgi:hypothetical protein
MWDPGALWQNTVLRWASEKGFTEVALALMDRGAIKMIRNHTTRQCTARRVNTRGGAGLCRSGSHVNSKGMTHTLSLVRTYGGHTDFQRWPVGGALTLV